MNAWRWFGKLAAVASALLLTGCYLHYRVTRNPTAAPATDSAPSSQFTAPSKRGTEGNEDPTYMYGWKSAPMLPAEGAVPVELPPGGTPQFLPGSKSDIILPGSKSTMILPSSKDIVPVFEAGEVVPQQPQQFLPGSKAPSALFPEPQATAPRRQSPGASAP